MALVHHWKAQIEDVYIRLSGSWLAAGFVILFAYAAAALLLDDYPILPDGLRSMATAGYFDPAPDFRLVFERLAGVSQQHVPGYFLTLFAWANIAGWDPLVLRLLSIWSGVFSLALIYRLARDFVGREAGFIAVVMLASLAFYNYWYLPIRMYTMFVAAELLLLWIYFRIVWRQRTSLGAYIALGLSCLFFLSTQVFSLAICCGLAIYHLIYPRKTRHWLYVALAGTIALLVLLPWIGTLMTGAVEIVEGEFGEIDVLNPLQLTETVFSMGSERQYRVCRVVDAITATSPCSRSRRDSALGYPGGGDRLYHRGQSIDRRDRLASDALSRGALPACHPLGGQGDDEPGAVEARFHRRSAVLDRQRLAVPAAGWRGLLRAFVWHDSHSFG